MRSAAREQSRKRLHERPNYQPEHGNLGESAQHNEAQQHKWAIGFKTKVGVLHGRRQQAAQDFAAIQRRYGNQVKKRQDEIDKQAILEHGDRQGIALGKRQHTGMCEPQHHAGNECEYQVGDRPGECDQQHIAVGIAKIAGVNRYRLGPSKIRHKQHDRAQRIEMLDGIEREASHEFCRGITQPIGHVSMSKLVNRQRDEDGRCQEQQLIEGRQCFTRLICEVKQRRVFFHCHLTAHENFGDATCNRRLNFILHFHGLNDDQALASFHRLPFFDFQPDD